MDEERRHGELRAIAQVQWQVLHVRQIRSVGFSDTEITGLQQRAILHRSHRGIYTYGTDRPPWKGALLAAQWSCGDDAYLTGRSALAIARVRGLYLGRIEVGVPRRTVRARMPPIHVQRTSATPERLRHDGLLRYVTVPRALYDMAADGAEVLELRRFITEAIHLGRFDHAEMRTLLETEAGHAGVRRLREAYSRYLPRRSAHSGLERSFDTGLATRPHIPEPEPNVRIEAGGISWEVDRYWPGEKVGVELHGGGYHDAAEDREKDDFKAAKLAVIGIQILAVSDSRWELEPEACLDDVEAVLARRGWRRSA